MAAYELLTPDGMISSNELDRLVGTRIMSCAEDGTGMWETVQGAVSKPTKGPAVSFPTLGLRVQDGHRLIARDGQGHLTAVGAEDLAFGPHPIMTAPLQPVDDREDPTVDDGVLYRTGERIRAAISGETEVGQGRWMWEKIAPAHVAAALFSLSNRQVTEILRGITAQSRYVPMSVIMCHAHPEVANLIRHLLTPHGWTVDITLIPFRDTVMGACYPKPTNTALMGHGATDTLTEAEPERWFYPITDSGRYFAFSPTSSALYQSLPL